MNKTKDEILLETGTNELEVLEFTIAGNAFGINVAKVRELLQYKPVQPMPRSHPNIEGVFKPRKEVITVVNLASYLGLPDSEEPERDIFIIAGFNNMNIAFHVHAVETIHRISWQAIEKPDSAIYGGQEGIVTGIAKIKGSMISIIDFEKIMVDVSPSSGLDVSSVAEHAERAEQRLLIAEDSQMLRRMLLEALHKAGFMNVEATSNGEEAWQRLNQIHDQQPDKPIAELISCVITDIEMPRMDGHFLTRKIKEHAAFKRLPVVIFSSLIDEEMHQKGIEVGADAQLSKPEIKRLVGVIDEIVERAAIKAAM